MRILLGTLIGSVFFVVGFTCAELTHLASCDHRLQLPKNVNRDHYSLLYTAMEEHGYALNVWRHEVPLAPKLVLTQYVWKDR